MEDRMCDIGNGARQIHEVGVYLGRSNPGKRRCMFEGKATPTKRNGDPIREPGGSLKSRVDLAEPRVIAVSEEVDPEGSEVTADRGAKRQFRRANRSTSRTTPVGRSRAAPKSFPQ